MIDDARVPRSAVPGSPRAGGPFLLAIDVGGTKVAAGVVASDGRLAASARVPTGAGDGPEAVIRRILDLARGVVAEARLPPGELLAAGIACGGPLDPHTGVVRAPLHLPGWRDVPLASIVGGAFHVPSFLDNDANAAALGEHRFGAGRGTDDLVYLTISTGIGGGVISGGRLLRGATGNAAELGHVCVMPDGRPCRCGARGCLEAYASGANLADRAREEIAAGAATALDPGSLDAASIVAAAAAGDPLARSLWDEALGALGVGLASMINAFDPERVIIGGGLTRAGEALFAPVRRAALERSFPLLPRTVSIVPAALGDDVGIMGAAAVALHRLEEAGERPRASRAGGPGVAAPGGAQGTGDNALLPDAPGARGTVPGTPADAAAPQRAIAVMAREDRVLPARLHELAEEHLRVAADTVAALLPDVEALAAVLAVALGEGHKLVTFGNGGSAADAQHFAAELVGRFRRERRALAAIALTVDPSAVTCIANDYDWNDVFARQVEAIVLPGDVVVGISTGGQSENVVRGLAAARLQGATTVALSGGSGGRTAVIADRALIVPSDQAARVQEMHELLIHLVCERLDDRLLGETA